MTFSPDPRKVPRRPTWSPSSRQGYNPEGYTLYTYAAIQAFAAAAEKAGSTDLEAVAEALQRRQFDTVLGTLALRRQGRPQGPELRHVRVEGRQVHRDRS